MIFHPESARLIMRGRKTVARRPVKQGERRCWIRPGHSYAVQPGLGREMIGRIAVTDVQLDRLGNISFDEVRAEGFRTTDEFKISWVRQHDKAWVARQERTIVDSLVDGDVLECEDGRALVDQKTLARFDMRHADRMVWVIRFELDRSHRARLLAPAARAARDGDEHGYTENPRRALRDEPEAVDAQVLNEYVADARAREAGQSGRREELLRRRAKSLALRLRQEAVTAQRNGTDITGALDQIEAHLRILEGRR